MWEGEKKEEDRGLEWKIQSEIERWSGGERKKKEKEIEKERFIVYEKHR